MAAARELARNPDSPASLQIMSAVGKSMGPRVKAADQVRQALEEQLEEDGRAMAKLLRSAEVRWQKWHVNCRSPRVPPMTRYGSWDAYTFPSGACAAGTPKFGQVGVLQ